MLDLVVHVVVSLAAGIAGAAIYPLIPQRFKKKISPRQIPQVVASVVKDHYLVTRHSHTCYEGTDRILAEDMWNETKGSVIFKNGQPRGVSVGNG